MVFWLGLNLETIYFKGVSSLCEITSWDWSSAVRHVFSAPTEIQGSPLQSMPDNLKLVKKQNDV